MFSARGSGIAVQTLFEIAADEAAKPADRIRAANSILDLGLRGREWHSFPERLAHLEEKWKPPEDVDPMQELRRQLGEMEETEEKAGIQKVPSLLYPVSTLKR